MGKITLDDALNNYQDLLGSLMYKNYRFNRQKWDMEGGKKFDIKLWQEIYGSRVEELEKLYQLELKKENMYGGD